jgi:hypothetical protein
VRGVRKVSVVPGAQRMRVAQGERSSSPLHFARKRGSIQVAVNVRDHFQRLIHFAASAFQVTFPATLDHHMPRILTARRPASLGE